MQTAASVTERPESESILRPSEAEGLWEALGSLTDRGFDELTPDACVDLALAVPSLLPRRIHRQILGFRRYAPNGDILLLHGLLPNQVVPPPTVKDSGALPFDPVTRSAALLLLGVMSMIGEPFNYKTLWSGRLVQNLIPVPGKEYMQTSQSSSGLLDWHVEDGFREDRCDYAGLLCLRGDPAGASRYAQARDLQLPPQMEALLREPRFQVRPDPAHELSGPVFPRRVAVISGPVAAPEIVYDTHHIEAANPADHAAASALLELHRLLDSACKSHVMSKGDLLIFDNKRVVHARTPFVARFDGTDRWLMRTMVCSSAVAFRRWGRRVVE